MSGPPPKTHATRSSTKQQQNKEVSQQQQQTLKDSIHNPILKVNPIIQDDSWQPVQSRRDKRKEKQETAKKSSRRLSFRQPTKGNNTLDDMDITQDTSAGPSGNNGTAKDSISNPNVSEKQDVPINQYDDNAMSIDKENLNNQNDNLNNQKDDQLSNKDNQFLNNENQIHNDNSNANVDPNSEIFAKAKPLLVKISNESIPGKNLIQKKFNLRKQLAGINVTLAGGFIFDKKEPEYIIMPISKRDYEKIINLEIDIIDDDQSRDNNETSESDNNQTVKETVKFTPYNKVKKVFTDEEKEERNRRTIKVINIPIEIQNYQIRAIFGRYGEIEENGFFTRIRNLYVQAFITYKKEDSLTQFYNGTWSEWIGKHQVYIIPKVLSEEETEKRAMFTVKLTGLPWNSTAFDLHEALEVNNPKYIFIPRNPNNNKPLNYAIIYYDNDENLAIASERNIIFCNRALHWGIPGEKSCHRCGSFDHLVSNCDIEPSTKPKVMNRKEKLKEFRQANNRKFKKGSFANVAKQDTSTRYQRNNNTRKFSNNNSNKVNRFWNKNLSRDRNDNEKSRDQGIFSQIKELNDHLTQLTNEFTKIRMENNRIKEEFTKYKNNRSTTTSGKNIKVNKDRSTIAIQNENNKRSRIDSDNAEPSGSSDLDERLNKQNNEINRFGNALSAMNQNISKIMAYFTSDDNNVNNSKGKEIIDDNEPYEV